MNWSLSEYLDLLELHAPRWCFVNLGPRSGFRLPHSEAVFIHAFLGGKARITTAAGQVLDCGAGDIAIVLTGEAHKVRNLHGRTAMTLHSLLEDGPSDQPLAVNLGGGPIENRLLSTKARVLWPTSTRPARLPAMALLRDIDVGIDLAHIARQVMEPGGSALLNSLAKLLFIDAFRNHPLCRAQIELNLDDPIARAKVIIERYPFEPWKVASLADRVGMGRSNFARRFAAQIGHAPIEFLAAERMRRAAALLSDSNLKIAELSERIGYRSEAAFITRFKEQFGMTPARWRKTHRAAT